MIDTVIFDLEGVIIDTEPLWDASNRQFLGMHGIGYDRGAIKHLIAGRSLADGTRVMKEVLGLPGDLETLVAQRRSTVESQLRGAPGFVPGSLQFIEAVKSSRKCCVATSMDPQLLAVVDGQLNLSALFGGNLFTIAEVGFRAKPDPAIFLYAARRLGSSPEGCVVIEDSPNGVQAAKSAGMRCIALALTFDPALLSAADRIVGSFGEIELDTDWP